MRLAILFAAAATVLSAAPPVNDIALSEHASRRAALRKALPNAVIVLPGDSEPARGGLRTPFFQEANFLYLTGWREPGALLLIAPEGEFLFLPKRDEIRDRYTGRKAAPDDPNIAVVTGFEHVLETGELAAKLKSVAVEGRPLYWLPSPVIKEALPGRDFQSAERPIARLRMIKSPAEIARIQHSVDATIAAHLAAWQRVKAGLFEYQVASTMGNVYFEQGCERHAYMPIVASGPMSIALHYSANKRRMDSGELLLMDVGAECADYAADITRTVPVNGRFTTRQKEVYEIVLGAQKAAIEAAKPGMKLLGLGEDSLNGIARKYVDTHGKDLHGESLVKYYLHSLGHHVGLDVHDATDPDLTLQPGMVVTIEPGIYIAEEAIGVRIEDMILITGHGARVMSAALPRSPGEIEKRLHQQQR
jgi:Xaa-Pro aminopeptidase